MEPRSSQAPVDHRATAAFGRPEELKNILGREAQLRHKIFRRHVRRLLELLVALALITRVLDLWLEDWMISAVLAMLAFAIVSSLLVAPRNRA